MRSVLLSTLLFTLFTCPDVGASQSSANARIVTRDGQTIEGTFVGATEASLSMRVGGDVVEVPVERVDYLSFKDETETDDDLIDLDASPMEKAFDAFWELQDTIEVAQTRDQYAEKLRSTTAAVNAYLENVADDWPELRRSMTFALTKYRQTLESDGWKQTGTEDDSPVQGLWDHAEGAVEFAEYLVSNSTPDHEETAASRKIAIGETLRGRLGPGDSVMSRDLDVGSARAYNDLYTFSLDQPSRVEIYVESMGPMTPHITLVDSTGNKLVGDSGLAFEARSLKTLTSGEYVIWIGGTKPGEVGLYELTLALDSR